MNHEGNRTPFLTCIVVFAFAAFLCGCAEPEPQQRTSEDSAATNIAPILLEGLPAAGDDHFEAEKQNAGSEELFGEWFYEAHVPLPEEELFKLVDILTAEGALTKWGPKLCGKFHPDWMLKFSREGRPMAFLICFGCYEVKVYDGDEETIYDLVDPARKIFSPFSAIYDLIVRSHPSRKPAKIIT